MENRPLDSCVREFQDWVNWRRRSHLEYVWQYPMGSGLNRKGKRGWVSTAIFLLRSVNGAGCLMCLLWVSPLWWSAPWSHESQQTLLSLRSCVSQSNKDGKEFEGMPFEPHSNRKIQTPSWSLVQFPHTPPPDPPFPFNFNQDIFTYNETRALRTGWGQ